ncbi:hypothetical protein [Turicibacter sanguinis]|uniref:hypothetical protein n=1 Tax=Turicibacter sanguinis TaxID=154288 RepID=UPI0018AC0788|nr:hypothetical protein [Turicibacter sanguinis]MDB8551499.1 hypothetical protein [Turicibacter sanguinis]
MLLSQSTLSVSDWIQIFAIIVTFGTSVVAIVISVASLKQTEKITREANKPVINISLEYFQDKHMRHYYLCIKNVGNSRAVIKSIKYYPEDAFKTGGSFINKITPFSLNPSQKITTSCKLSDYNKLLIFDVEFSWDNEVFEESFVINPVTAFSSIEPIPDKLTIEKAIIHAARQITRNNF